MQRPSFTDFDRSYRRGVVLGLSLAELFILLVFLLLLAMVGYVSTKEQELNNIKKALAEQTSRAVVAESERDKASVTIKKLQEQRGNPIKDDDPNNLIVSLTTENRHLNDKVNELQDTLEQATPAADNDEPGLTSDRVPDVQQGQDSPCWYRMDKRRSNGEDYERSLYIFNIRISDRHIFVKDIDAPTPKYQKQKDELEFDRSALNQNLDYTVFARAFQSLKQAGDNKQIRDDRRCTFYVRVWDTTGATNKSGYKRAHNEFVQGIFNTYEVNYPWPH